MNRNLPALGIRFSIDKLEEMDSRSSYGQVAWRVLCRTEDISRFPPGTFFFEGDTAKTLNGSEYVYCLAIQLSEAGLFPKIRMAISQDADYQRVAASPQFVDDRSLCAEPFPEAGHIDIKGNLVVHQYSLLRPAFGFVRKEKRPVIDVHTDFQLPDRVKPASARTAKLPSMNSVEELETFLKSGFSQSGHSFWAVTPEELVEIVEACQHKIQAHCVDYASHFSGDPFCVVLADK